MVEVYVYEICWNWVSVKIISSDTPLQPAHPKISEESKSFSARIIKILFYDDSQ